jgi:hypothetical protein
MVSPVIAHYRERASNSGVLLALILLRASFGGTEHVGFAEDYRRVRFVRGRNSSD